VDLDTASGWSTDEEAEPHDAGAELQLSGRSIVVLRATDG
jgi:hypothetical protein